MSLTNDQITAQNFSDFYNKISPYLGIAHAGFTPVGALVVMTGNEVPANHLACDGTVYNISAYPELAAFYARSQGACNFYGGDGTTTFAVPDLRGEFLRGTGTNSHTNQGNGASVGVHQDATEHVYFEYDSGGHLTWMSNYSNTKRPNKRDTTINGASSKPVIDNQTTNNDEQVRPQAYTARPTNTSFLICVAAKNIFNDVGNNYSLEEQEVGVWYNGDKVYQRTYDCGQMPNATTKSIPLGMSLSSIRVIKLWGIAYNPTTGGAHPLPYNTTDNLYIASGGNIAVATTGDRRDFYATVTFQYIKLS